METNGNDKRNATQFDEEVCERYLFGELSEPEQEEFETAYFDDDAFFDRFVAVKTELLDLYARNELDVVKRDRMERRFFATETRRKRLAASQEFIRAVTTIADRDRVPPVDLDPTPSLFDSVRRFFTLPKLAAAFVLLIAVGGAIVFVTRQEADQSAQLPSSNAEATNVTSDPSPQQELTTIPPQPSNEGARTPSDTTSPKRKRPGAATTPVSKEPKVERATNRQADPEFALNISTVGRDNPEPSITLQPGSTRDVAAGNTLTLEADDDRLLSIALLFADDRHTRYAVTITTVDGSEVSRTSVDRRAARKTKDGFRRLVVPINDLSALRAKDYLVRLDGKTRRGKLETINEYYFHVTRVGDAPSAPQTKP